MIKTSEVVKGNWKSILPFFGLGSEYLTGKHSPCPICKDGGKDRFRFDDKEGRGTFFCTHCGAGDGFKLLELKQGWSFHESAKRIDEYFGTHTPKKQSSKTGDIERRRNRLSNLKSKFQLLSDNDEVVQYLSKRGISLQVINALNSDIGLIGKVDYWNGGRSRGQYEAMACVVTNNDKPVTYHLTYLDKSSHAGVDQPRKVMPPLETITGGSVRLFDYLTKLGIAEGVETAIAATQLFNIPTWAALNANSLASFSIPDGLKELHIFGDNDASYTGQKAAYELAHRARQQGLTVKVYIPETGDTDWNDELISQSVGVR